MNVADDLREHGRASGRRDAVVGVAVEDVSETNVMAAALSDAGLRVEAQVPAASAPSGSLPASSVCPDRLDDVDLLIVDADSPHWDALLGALGREGRRPPVVVVSRDGGVRAVARALDGGADDYLVRPVHPDELAARVRAVLRRTMPPPERGCLDLDGVRVDLDRRVATRAGAAVVLSRVEWLLLERLALEPGAVVRHEALLSDVWGLDQCESGRWLRVWVGRLRRRLGWKAGSGGPIETIPGVGYRLAERSTCPGDDDFDGVDDGADARDTEGGLRAFPSPTPTAPPAAPAPARSRLSARS